jgi:hypothetical protein
MAMNRRSESGGGGGGGLSEFIFTATSYSTVRLARVHSFKITALFRTIQLTIISYIIGLQLKLKSLL